MLSWATLLASLFKVDLDCNYPRNTNSFRSLRSWLISASRTPWSCRCFLLNVSQGHSLPPPAPPFSFPRHCYTISQHTVLVIF